MKEDWERLMPHLLGEIPRGSQVESTLRIDATGVHYWSRSWKKRLRFRLRAPQRWWNARMGRCWRVAAGEKCCVCDSKPLVGLERRVRSFMQRGGT